MDERLGWGWDGMGKREGRCGIGWMLVGVGLELGASLQLASQCDGGNSTRCSGTDSVSAHG